MLLESEKQFIETLSLPKHYIWVKQILDIVLILTFLPVVILIISIVAICIKLDDNGKIFYSQPRVGYKGKVFIVYKLRSMHENNSESRTLVNDNRITRVGKVIRKMRIDELPQFFNVLKGEMSLIGPRAEFKDFAEQLEKEIPNYYCRYLVKPGISGLAQVTQGYAIGVEESKIKLEYDLFYIKNLSFALDVKIFFKTVKTVITGFGAR